VWSAVPPNLLIGLREGLEAGLIVSILVATLVRSGRRDRLRSVWTGVLAAVALSVSFAAVLTFAAASMSTAAQEAFGGVLSLVAVVFVTFMIFWMRRSARALSGELKDKATAALALGPGVLVLTAFLAVAREGLETSLFLWTTTRSAGESAGPSVGAAAGLVLAAGLCVGMYRRALKINLSRFFTYTGLGLIVIVSGVAGYGLRELQESGLLPGYETNAFDLSATLDPSAWYCRLVEGVFNVTPQMTVLQVVGYLAYLVPVLALFARGTRAARPAPARAPAAASAAHEPGPVEAQPSTPAQTSLGAPGAAAALAGARAGDAAAPAAAAPAAGSPDTAGEVAGTPGEGAAGAEPPATTRSEPGSGSEPVPIGPAPAGARRRLPRWALPVALVAVPALGAGAAIVVLGPSTSAGEAAIEVADGSCADGWEAPAPGRSTFSVHNAGTRAAEVRLVDPATGGIHAEIELLGPGTSRPLAATIGPGDYAWECLPDAGGRILSASRRVSGAAGAAGAGAGRAVVPVTEAEIRGPVRAYRTFVAAGLRTVQAGVDALRADVEAGDLDAARRDWLAARLDYERLGAAYGTFGDFDAAINGRPAGLPGGVHDPDFSGFRRIEYGLWHGEPAKALALPAAKLAADVAGLREAFPTQEFDPDDLALRAHEILENTLEFELTGSAGQGGGAELAVAAANVDGTGELLKMIAPLLQTRAPDRLADARSLLSGYAALVEKVGKPGGSWVSLDRLSRTERQQVNGRLGALLEALAPIPVILEIRSTG
jgi:high-affinity iron transporter